MGQPSLSLSLKRKKDWQVLNLRNFENINYHLNKRKVVIHSLSVKNRIMLLACHKGTHIFTLREGGKTKL